MIDKKTLHLPVFSTGEDMEINIIDDLCDTKSKYQRIQIVNAEKFGRCLIIDGLMQTAESDHEPYDREILSPLSADNTKLLILGGGDGYVALQAKKLNPQLEVTVVDIDEEVTKYCKKYLHNNDVDETILDGINFVYADAVEFLEKTADHYDGIVGDLTDAPIGASEVDHFTRFYEKLINAAHEKLRKTGWISIQAGSCEVHAGYIPAKTIIRKILFAENLTKINESCIFIPSYEEDWAFLFGRKT